MNNVIKTDTQLTGKYDYVRSGWTDIDDYLENCYCDCAAPSGWTLVEEGNTGQYYDGNYYVQFMSEWGQWHRRRDASDACRCAKVQQSNWKNIIHYDWDGTEVQQSLGTCNTATDDEYQSENCYFKACLLHDVCLLKFGHENCTFFIQVIDNTASLACLAVSRSVDSLQEHVNDSLSQKRAGDVEDTPTSLVRNAELQAEGNVVDSTPAREQPTAKEKQFSMTASDINAKFTIAGNDIEKALKGLHAPATQEHAERSKGKSTITASDINAKFTIVGNDIEKALKGLRAPAKQEHAERSKGKSIDDQHDTMFQDDEGITSAHSTEDSYLSELTLLAGAADDDVNLTASALAELGWAPGVMVADTTFKALGMLDHAWTFSKDGKCLAVFAATNDDIDKQQVLGGLAVAPIDFCGFSVHA